MRGKVFEICVLSCEAVSTTSILPLIKFMRYYRCMFVSVIGAFISEVNMTNHLVVLLMRIVMTMIILGNDWLSKSSGRR
jgi:hypothetical protein